MTIATYAALDQEEAIFDGAKARLHLEKRLGMRVVSPSHDRQVGELFSRWIARRSTSLALNTGRTEPCILVPPGWFR
jgi:hypothetical protein